MDRVPLISYSLQKTSSPSPIEIDPTLERKHQRVIVPIHLIDDCIKLEGRRPKKPIRRTSADALERHLPSLQQHRDSTTNEAYEQILKIIETEIVKPARTNPGTTENATSDTDLASWCDENKMTVNIEKSEVLKFRKSGATGKRKLYLHRKPLEIVSIYKYLGIVMRPLNIS